MTRITMLPKHNQRSSNHHSLCSWMAATVIALTLIAFLYVSSIYNQKQQNHPPNSTIGLKQQRDSSFSSKDIRTGRTETGVDYYLCSNDTHGSSPQHHLVLLHGSKFTKEDWKTSGILQQFCSVPQLTVTALDLPVKATHQDFVELLSKSSIFSQSLPVSAVVTPSASGKVITDWMINGDITQLPSYIQTWIPVASGSVHSTNHSQQQALKATSTKILTIYGNQDIQMGHDTAMLLQKWAGATSVELNGGHPCYLDSPNEFVQVVLKQALGIER